MELVRCCTLLLSLSIPCSCDSKIQLKNWDGNPNRRGLECLETFIDVADWKVFNFLVISGEMTVVDDRFFKRYQNFAWNVYSEGNNELPRSCNVILFAKDFHDLNQTLSTFSIRKIDLRAKFVISVAAEFSSLEEIKIASEGITAAMWNLDKTRVVYLVPCRGEVLAMTYFPFAKNCQVGDLEVLDTWRGKDFEKRAKFFPEKMLDIRGCVQNHSVHFSDGIKLQVNKEFTVTGEMVLGGIGGRLMTIVAEKMNMKLHLSPEPPESMDFLLQQVIQGKSLFSVGGNIPIATRLEFLDMSLGYMEEAFAFGYVSTGVEVSWKNFMSPFPIEAWIYMGCTLLSFIGLIFMLNRFDRREIASDKLTILDSFGIFLGNARVLPRSCFGRYLLGIWILYSFLMNAYYNSGLVSSLTAANEKRIINTLQDLLNAGIEFGGGKFHREFYHDPSDPIMTKIYNNFKIWSLDESESRLMNGEIATGVVASYLHVHNSNRTGNLNRELRMLEEKAFTYHVPVSMRRGSPFTLGVHRYGSRAIQSGLLDYWLKYYTRISFSETMGANMPTVISTRHLRGIFYFYITGLIFSSVVFLGEIIFHKYFLEGDSH